MSVWVRLPPAPPNKDDNMNMKHINVNMILLAIKGKFTHHEALDAVKHIEANKKVAEGLLEDLVNAGYISDYGHAYEVIEKTVQYTMKE